MDLYTNISLVQTFTDDPATLQKLQASYHPTVVYKACPRPEDTEQALALVCKGTSCLTPPTSWEQLLAQIEEVTHR